MTVLQQLQAHFQMAQGQLQGVELAEPWALETVHETIVRQFEGLELHSHYQPLFHARTLELFAHEALLRPRYPWQTLFRSPKTVFDIAQSALEAIYLDKLCLVVHTMNFVRQQQGEQPLFLNVRAAPAIGLAQPWGGF